MDYYKLDLTNSLINLEYICLEYKIPISILQDHKSKGDKTLVLTKKDNQFKEFARIDKDGNLFMEGDKIEQDDTFNIFYEDFTEFIDDIEPLELPVILEIDSILEKISKYGRNSLTMEEFDFLYKF